MVTDRVPPERDLTEVAACARCSELDALESWLDGAQSGTACFSVRDYIRLRRETLRAILIEERARKARVEPQRSTVEPLPEKGRYPCAPETKRQPAASAEAPATPYGELLGEVADFLLHRLIMETSRSGDALEAARLRRLVQQAMVRGDETVQLCFTSPAQQFPDAQGAYEAACDRLRYGPFTE